MPYSSEWKETVSYQTFTGIVTGRDILLADMDLYRDKRFDQLRYALFDFSGATSIDVSKKEMKEIAYVDRAAAISNPKITVVVITDNHDLMRELTNLYAEYIEPSPWETVIFDTIEETKEYVRSLGYTGLWPA